MRTTNSARVRATPGDRATGALNRNSSYSGVNAESFTRTRDIVSQVASSGDYPADRRAPAENRNANRPARSGGASSGGAASGRAASGRASPDTNRNGGRARTAESRSRSDRNRPDWSRDENRAAAQNFSRERNQESPSGRGRATGGPSLRPAAAERATAPGQDRNRSRSRPGEQGRGRQPFSLPSDGNGGKQRIVREKGKKGGCVKEIIDPARFVKKAVFVEKTEYSPVHAFSDFGLNERILKNVEAKGYVKPSPIQDKAIGPVMEGKDVVGIANTGTGKTAAFALPMVHKLIHDMTAKALILAPTRELAQQIQEEIISFSKNCGIRTVLIIGGNSINVQTRDLAKNPRIVIGTPGRLKDHINQGTLDLSGVTYTVLDEVDRMLDMGFIRDIRSIFSHVPKARQSVFFSATIDKEVERLILDFAKDPVTISLRENVTADGVDQDVVWYRDNDERIEKLHDLLIKGCEKTIIFDDTKRAVEKLGKELKKRGFRVDQIHGDKSQGQRTRAIRRLKEDEIDILVATDVAARGIDVSDISHVINYSQPVTYEDYVHRIGRTGRAGKTGQAFTFLQKA